MNDLVGSYLGQYLITELISHGGMATVYKGYQPSLDRNVAVKVLVRTHDAAFTARFEREARAIARLQHPYIMPIYDYGEQNGLLYLVLQYIEQGATLGDLVGTPMQPARALDLVRHVLDALDYAHRHGVIHRDIKPANILMRSPSWPLLGDFGIAKLANESGPLTQSGVLLGTATYMAPEQALGRSADVRTDLYSMGVVLYELLTGQIPFQGADPVSVLHQHAYAALPLPRSIHPDLPPILEQLLLRALSKNPDARYQTAADMARELGLVAEQLDRATDREQQRGLYEQGARAFEAEQWDRAVELLGQLVAGSPSYQDAAELLQLARAAKRHTRSRGWRFTATAARGTARTYMRHGQMKEQAGDLAGALADYQAAHAAAADGRAREELAALLAGLTAKLRREQHRLPGGAAGCPQCGRQIQLEWAGCPYCFAALKGAAPALRSSSPRQQSDKTTELVSWLDEARPAMAAEPVAKPQPESTPPSKRRTPSPTPKLRALQMPARPIRRSPRWATLMLALVLLSGGGGIIWANQPRPTPAVGDLASISASTALPTVTNTLAPTQLQPSMTPDVASPTAPLAIVATAVSATATPTITLATARDALNLRTGPGTSYPSLGRYDAGTAFMLVGRNGAATWFKVRAPDDRVGWMSAQFLQVNVPVSDIALAAEPALPTATRTPKPPARQRPPTPAPQQPTALAAPVEAPTSIAPPADAPTATPEATATQAPRPTDKPKREPTDPPKEPPPPPKEPPPPPK